MKTVTIYTDGKVCCANLQDAPTRSRLRRNRSGMAASAIGRGRT
ncbi:MAG: hypothetical protein RSC08_06265 [Oscillospiraceae bacterium]